MGADKATSMAAAPAGDDNAAASGEGMACVDHPYRSNPGGICAFCLQEKLGKLLSSSASSSPFFSIPSSSSASSSDAGACRSSSKAPPQQPPPMTSFHRKKPNPNPNPSASSSSSSTIFKRSKSVAPRPIGISLSDPTTAESPRKKSFWAFITYRKQRDLKPTAAAMETSEAPMKENLHQNQEAESPSFGRKVARSRSVGCGSRSFSGDFLERISTGFGDCTLRRVESHRESNNKISDEQRIKERVKCGGIFGGFGMMTSSSPSSYWLSAAAAAAAAAGDGDDGGINATISRINNGSRVSSSASAMVRGGGKSRSWIWAFASPMRAFKPATTSSSKSYAATNPISSINASKSISGGNSSSRNGKVGVNPLLLAAGG